METTIERLEPGIEEPLAGDQTDLGVAAAHYLASKSNAAGDGNYSYTASWALTEFVDGMYEDGIDAVGDLDKHALSRYAAYLKREVAKPDAERPFSAESARTYYNVVAGFLSWAVRRDLVDTNYARKQVAIDELPNADGGEKQQFWSERTRERLLRYVDWKTEDVLAHGWMDEQRALRDRAYVGLLALTGARNGELLRSPRDGRRAGLRWADVDFDAGIVHVLGKSQEREEVPLLDRSARWLRAHRRRLDPPRDDWPVFPSGHAPSRYGAAREGLRRRGYADDEVEALLEQAPVDEVLREHEIPPPSMTTEAGRGILRDFSEETNLTEDGAHLKPHGARRGVGQAYFTKVGHEAAQKVLRHRDPAVTSEQYSHVETQELREIGEGILGDDRHGADSATGAPEGDQ
jgi:integrase